LVKNATQEEVDDQNSFYMKSLLDECCHRSHFDESVEGKNARINETFTII
jgi:hypothetical protein